MPCIFALFFLYCLLSRLTCSKGHSSDICRCIPFAVSATAAADSTLAHVERGHLVGTKDQDHASHVMKELNGLGLKE